MWWQKIFRSAFVLREGYAHRVIFYYFGEDPTYVDESFVTIFSNGCVEIQSRNEHVSTHVQNVEILWRNKNVQTVPANAKGRNLSLIKSTNKDVTDHQQI